MQAPLRQPAEPSVRQRVRIRFSKQGDLRLIGHRDLARAMERLFRRAGLPLALSQGFHPKPRISFPAALAVGIEGLDELMEIELADQVDAGQLLRRLNDGTVPGLTFLRVDVLPPPPEGKKARLTRLTYQIAVPAEREAQTAQRVADLRARPSCTIRRPDRPNPIDLLEFLEDLDLSEGTLSMTLRVSQQAGPGPRDVLAALHLDDLESQGARLRRTRVEVHS